VRVSDAGGDRRVLIDGVEEYAEVDSSAGTMLARYTHDVSRVDALLAQVKGGVKTHAVTDALGSIYALTDATATVQARYSYDAFGARASSTENVATAWGFTGRNHDPAGLMYYRHRYYEPSIGTWLSADPLKDVDGPNLYRYVRNNPSNNQDPLGLLVLVYCRYTDWNAWAGGGPRHCAVRVRCEYGKDYCSPRISKPDIPDTLYELSELTFFDPWAGIARAGVVSNPWQGTTRTGTASPENPLQLEISDLLPGYGGTCEREQIVVNRIEQYGTPKYWLISGPNSNTFVKRVTSNVLRVPMPTAAWGWDVD